uniref:Disintegrin and metalloproteinase domain-containing protein 9-like n=1 Tax=Sinocyclocheilus anshuiensis TaxID=1608454 RepID=A0A671RSY7_9TELE
MVNAVRCRLAKSAFMWLMLHAFIDCSEGSVTQQTSRLSSYEVTVPRHISRLRRNQGSADKVSYMIQAQGKEHVVILERNELLFPEDFTVYSYAKDGSRSLSLSQGHCHYSGYIEDVEGSSAALSLCSGLRGVIHTEGTSFGIEPLEGSTSDEHLVYRLEDVKTGPLSCGTPHFHNHDDEASPRKPTDSHVHNITFGQAGSHLIRKKRAVLHQTHYVELLLVVDHERFNYKKRNQTAVREEMVQIANYVDSMYMALNIRIVLVGLEIWSEKVLCIVHQVKSCFPDWSY